jgi:hypothetical protein
MHRDQQIPPNPIFWLSSGVMPPIFITDDTSPNLALLREPDAV